MRDTDIVKEKGGGGVVGLMFPSVFPFSIMQQVIIIKVDKKNKLNYIQNNKIRKNPDRKF